MLTNIVKQVDETYYTEYKAKGEPKNSYRETTFEGPFDSLCTQADTEKSTGSKFLAVQCTVKRIAGNLGKLTIRKQNYTGNESDEINFPGSSRDVPKYRLSIMGEKEPILTHPLAKGYEGPVLDALKALCGGASLGDEIRTKDESGKALYRTVSDVLNGQTDDLIEKIKKGHVSYYDPKVVVSCSYTVKDVGSIKYQPYCKISSPPGPIPSPPAGRNWLCLGTEVSVDGDKVEATDTYILSGPDGWDKDTYK